MEVLGMNSNNEKNAIDILDYWFAIEFLEQDSSEKSTRCLELNRTKQKHMKELFQKKENLKNKNRDKISIYFEWNREEKLYDMIRKEAQACKMETWGNITIFLGKIKREEYILSLADYLKIKDDERPEENYDDIIMASFQVNAKGIYIEKSFSLSPLLWATEKVKSSKGNKISALLSKEEYEKDIIKIEETFLTFTNLENVEGINTDEEKGMPVFSDEYLIEKKIEEVYSKLKVRYIDKVIIKSNPDSKSSYYCGINTQFFINEEVKEQCGQSNYFGLSKDYFSKDLKMVKEAILNNKIPSFELRSSLLSYINAPSQNIQTSNRRDLLNPKNKNELQDFLLEVLNIENAPLGKWPSRYMPVLMQQVAINFAVSDGNKGVFKEKKKIFSVNGSPGTGKTTLLKEIIAGNIVERAKLLARYENPDDAFVKHPFKHGEKKKGAYSQYTPSWYSFKEDKINNYSILVVSSNNSAVENITRELPIETGIQEDLKSNKEDSGLMIQQLQEVSELFSVEKSKQKEQLFVKDNKSVECAEIYFSGYAKKLFGEEAWGMIAAPLGKNANIYSFYDNVLKNLLWDFYPKTNSIIERKVNYLKIKEQFKKQLEKVEQIQKDLADYARLGENLKKHKESIIDLTKEKKVLERKLRNKRKEIEQEIIEENRLASSYLVFQNLSEEKAREINRIETERKLSSENIEKLKRDIWEIESSIGVMTRLFKARKYHAARALIEFNLTEIEFLEEKQKESNYKLEGDKLLSNQMRENLHIEEQKKLLKQRKIQGLMEDKISCKELIEKYDRKIEEEEQLLKSELEKYNEKIQEFKISNPTKVVLDGQFIEELLSPVEEESTRAQVNNPWTTDSFDREREKLLYYSLQLNREFILSSKPCRDNFITLCQYWGFRKGDGNKKIKFDKEDKEAMVGSLFQTLSLLIPVISTTFASVQTFLEDVKQPGIIGTLIVDEAGQAQPQMAVGALYRSRKAIIVGDPKQVEPIVTDDLELLKKFYKEEHHRPYKDKTLSVQKFADILNPIGTYLENGTDFPDWVGCPLLVHRRCISPMYDISNKISYGGIMKQQTTLPSDKKKDTFVFSKSQWLNIRGDEEGKKDHYVKKQGEVVCKMLNTAFSKERYPSLYIISPFTSVVKGMKDEIKNYRHENKETALGKSGECSKWMKSNIGTVHTFQGKEANEVIFLLGCDSSSGAAGAISWVSSNIVNVAVTRAKYRLYIIGDASIWRKNEYISEAKATLDIIALKNIVELLEGNTPENERRAKISDLAKELPPSTSFMIEEDGDDLGEKEYIIETDGFVSDLSKSNFLNKNLNNEQLSKFGFEKKRDFDILSEDIKKNLDMGMRIYYLLEPVYKISKELDASCCGILFCKALELQIKRNFYEGLKVTFPNYRINRGRNKIQLKDAQTQDFMLGTIQYILKNNIESLGKIFVELGNEKKGIDWWNIFNEKLKKCANIRNNCCHPQLFLWDDMKKLIEYGYGRERELTSKKEIQLEGMFFESEIGKELNSYTQIRN